MAKRKKTPSDLPPASTLPSPNDAPDPERDLVFFFSRLTHTLENACGRDKLADSLAAPRREPPEDAAGKPPSPAITRAFRRLGLVQASDDIDAFLDVFTARVGAAVSRDPRHVRLLIDLFAAGDDKIDLKPVCGATPICVQCQLSRECQYYNNPRKPEMALLSPAARLMSGHDGAVSDAELLAIALFGEKASGNEEVIATMLARYGRLRAVFRADPHEYMGIRDMGKAQGIRLAAMALLHRRLLAERRDETLRITCAKDIHDRYAPELRDYRVEAAVLLMLDQQNNVIRDAWFCEGSPNLSYVGIADLLRPAMREFSCRVALVHNHPSGNANPSQADINFTRRLRAACDIVNIALVDHVIVTEDGYYSFAEEGMLGA